MKIITFIILSIIAYFISTDIYTPSMPIIAREFNVHRDIVQHSLTYFLAGAILSCLFSGIIADHYGKRRILLMGLLIAIMGSILAAFCTSINQLLFARILQGMGGATVSVIGLAMIHDYTPEHKATKVFGILGIYFAIIPALAPAFGGYITNYFGWRYNFHILVALYICSFIGILKIVPKDMPDTHKKQNLFRFKDYYCMLTTRSFMFILLISPLFVSGEWFMISYLPFYIQEKFQYSPELYGLFLTSLMPWYACGSYLAGKYGQKIGLNNLIYLAITLGILASVVLFIIALTNIDSIIPIYISLFIYFLGFGLLFPATTTKVFAYFPDLKATSSSLRSIVVTSFSLLGTVFADIADENQLIHFAFYFCAFSTLALFLFRFRGETSV
ncbi:MAG: MFS transporter [Alphaproteobacteria bacterium]|nr:MFS transporter [Alphaproteobacteria bacterium]